MGTLVLGLAMTFAVIGGLSFFAAVFYDGLSDFWRGL